MADHIQLHSVASGFRGDALSGKDVGATNEFGQPIKLQRTSIAGADGLTDATTGNPVPTSLAGVSTAANQAASATLTGTVTETAPASDTASSGLNGRLQRIAQRLTSLIAQIPATLGIKTAANSLSIAPASDAKFTVITPQSPDAANSTTYTNLATQYVGSWTATRSVGVVRQLVVLASTVPSGLGGTFVFEYGEDAATATISESRVISDFATVRDFDLINAGAYFRVKFTPSRAVTGAEFVFINTTHRTTNDGAFVRLANQEIEEANAAMGQTFAYQKNFNKFSGKSENVRSDAYVPVMGSTTPLGSGGTFNTGLVDLSDFNYIVTHIVSNVAGSITITFYADAAGVTAVRTLTKPYTANEVAWFGSKLYSPYVRAIYTNGGTAQTTFYTATKVHKEAMSGQVLGIGEFVPTNILTSVQRSVIMGTSPAGAYENVTVNSAKNLIVADWLTEVAKGSVLNHSLVRLTGLNPDCDAGVSETVWGVGGTYTFPVAAAVVAVVSSSVLDAAAGTGARTVTITGLNSSYVAISETVTLNGIVPVNTSAAFLRIDTATVVTAGVGGSNAGTITGTISLANQFQIQINKNVSQRLIYTVPAGYTGYLIQTTLAGSLSTSAAVVTGEMFTRVFGGLFVVRDNYAAGATTAGSTIRYIAPLILTEKTDLYLQALASTNNTIVNARADILLIAN